MNNLWILVLFVLFCMEGSCQVTPIWLTNNYVQARRFKIIDGNACSCTVSVSTRPSSTLTFTTAFSVTPNLAYGISGIEGTL